MNLSNLIKSKRIQKNMTMEELASKLGVNQSTITRWESGNIKSIKADKVPLLSKYLDIPIEKILPEDSINKLKNSIKTSINGLNNKAKKTEESVKFLQKNNFTDCNFADSIGIGENVVINNNKLKTISQNSTASKIYEIVDQLTDEGQERLLEQAEFLLGRYKK